MKKIITLAFFIFSSFLLIAQTDGISYQAVIIGPNPQELPGADALGNILPNTKVAIRFTIINSNNNQEYQEVQTTLTDVSGRINLIIGEADPDAFSLISWDGTPKDLKVEIDFNGSGGDFVDMSRQKLTFVPYAYHRNITAAGTLTVDDATFLNGELTVQGPTNLNSTLDVNNNNDTNLSGILNVEGATYLKDSLSVLNKKNTFLSGDLTVEGKSDFADIKTKYLIVEETSNLNGQVTIDTNLDDQGDDSEFNAYPLKVQGSSQGIAIKVNGIKSTDIDPVTLSDANNFISFYDENGKMWGRIEGKSLANLLLDPNYIYETSVKTIDGVIAGADFAIAGFEVAQGVVDLGAASSSSTACVGFGACVTAPIPAFIISAGANLVLKISNAVIAGVNLGLVIADGIAYQVNEHTQLGVSYQSGAADYAEWLPKLNPTDIFLEGDLVGITNGFITKSTFGADKVMVISTNPIVLGNMPQLNNQANFEKVAFMGQVPVKVLGKVNPGDYILPSIIGGSFGRAVNPANMEIKDYKKIVGVAWSVISKIANDVNLVNVAVGLNTNDLISIVSNQEDKFNSLKSDYDKLKSQIDKSNSVLANLVPGYADATGVKLVNTETQKPIYENKESPEDHFLNSTEDDIVYFEISKEQVETCLQVAREHYKQVYENKNKPSKLFINKNSNTINSKVSKGIDSQFNTSLEEHPFWSRIDSEPAYKEEIIQFIKSSLEESIHTHKKYQHQFIDLNIKK